VILQELSGRIRCYEHHGHDLVLKTQPVTVVLHNPNMLVSDAGRMAATDKEASVLIEDHTERVGLETADMVGVIKERFEHGCPPRK
jgi:hypothetical protein